MSTFRSRYTNCKQSDGVDGLPVGVGVRHLDGVDIDDLRMKMVVISLLRTDSRNREVGGVSGKENTSECNRNF